MKIERYMRNLNVTGKKWIKCFHIYAAYMIKESMIVFSRGVKIFINQAVAVEIAR
jgi:hypothetical protein